MDIIQQVRSGTCLPVNVTPIQEQSGDVIFVVGNERHLTGLNILKAEFRPGQPLKSLRDQSRKLPHYQPGFNRRYLCSPGKPENTGSGEGVAPAKDPEQVFCQLP